MPVLIYHPSYRTYDLGPQHPFNPTRVEMVLDLLRELAVRFELLAPKPASAAELLVAHDGDYIAAVEATSSGLPTTDLAAFGLGTPDNPVVPGMADGARALVGGTLMGAQLIADRKATTVLQLGGGLHHARRRAASGFCVYNDLAVAIRHLTGRGLRVAYLDLDVHHGDGVQEICYSDEHVMTISLHESGEYLFPGTGWLHELGQGIGRGLRLNLPLEPFTEGHSYLTALTEIMEAALEFFRPDALVVQAGADAHFLDPLADLMLTTRDFEHIYRTVIDLARRHAGGRTLFTLGGGYSPAATPRVWTILALVLLGSPLPAELPPSWLSRWQERLGIILPLRLHDPERAFDPIPRRSEIERANRQQVQRLLDAVAPLWW